MTRNSKKNISQYDLDRYLQYIRLMQASYADSDTKTAAGKMQHKIPDNYSLMYTNKATVGRARFAVYRNNTDGSVYIVFKGTSEMSEWKNNATAVMTDMYDKNGVRLGKVHSGFNTVLDEVNDEAVKAMNKYAQPGTKVYVLGHSLGGAVGTMFVSKNKLQGRVYELVTAGAPAIGDDDYNATLKDTNFVRFVNGDDVVPSGSSVITKHPVDSVNIDYYNAGLLLFVMSKGAKGKPFSPVSQHSLDAYVISLENIKRGDQVAYTVVSDTDRVADKAGYFMTLGAMTSLTRTGGETIDKIAAALINEPSQFRWQDVAAVAAGDIEDFPQAAAISEQLESITIDEYTYNTIYGTKITLPANTHSNTEFMNDAFSSDLADDFVEPQHETFRRVTESNLDKLQKYKPLQELSSSDIDGMSSKDVMKLTDDMFDTFASPEEKLQSGSSATNLDKLQKYKPLQGLSSSDIDGMSSKDVMKLTDDMFDTFASPNEKLQLPFDANFADNVATQAKADELLSRRVRRSLDKINPKPPIGSQFVDGARVHAAYVGEQAALIRSEAAAVFQYHVTYVMNTPSTQLIQSAFTSTYKYMANYSTDVMLGMVGWNNASLAQRAAFNVAKEAFKTTPTLATSVSLAKSSAAILAKSAFFIQLVADGVLAGLQYADILSAKTAKTAHHVISALVFLFSMATGGGIIFNAVFAINSLAHATGILEKEADQLTRLFVSAAIPIAFAVTIASLYGIGASAAGATALVTLAASAPVLAALGVGLLAALGVGVYYLYGALFNDDDDEEAKKQEEVNIKLREEALRIAAENQATAERAAAYKASITAALNGIEQQYPTGVFRNGVRVRGITKKSIDAAVKHIQGDYKLKQQHRPMLHSSKSIIDGLFNLPNTSAPSKKRVAV